MTDREKLAHEAWNVWDLDHHMANKPNEITAAKITACVAAAIAAAEERGRRSGIESAQLAVDAVVAVCDLHQDVQYRNGALMAAEAVRALAPRDSGKDT